MVVTKEWLIEHNHTLKKTVSEIAEEFGFSVTYLYPYFKKYHIEKMAYPEKSLRKTRETYLKKYGSNRTAIKEKFKQTCLERYGVDNPAKTESAKEKSVQTCLEKYGVKSINKVDITIIT